MTSEDGLIVFIDGVYQADNVYSVSGTTLTFATAPVNSRVIEVFQLEGGIIGTAPSIDTMTGDGSDTTLSLSVTPTSENQTFVTIDGVVQHKDTYAVSGSTLTFSAAPPTGTKVECITFSNVSIATFQDADNDTKIQVEESTDEDKIRFDIAGTEEMVMDASGIVINDGSNDRDFRIESNDSDGMLFVDGGNNRVGVGTSSPGTILHTRTSESTTNHNAGGGFNLTSSSTAANRRAELFLDADRGDFGTSSDGAYAYLQKVGDGGLFNIINQDSADTAFQQGGSERMRITSTGFIGMGTSNPLSELHVSDAGDCGIMLQSTNCNTDKEIFQIIVGANPSNDAEMIFRTRANAGTGGSEFMRLNSSGSLLIGKSSDVFGSVGARISSSGTMTLTADANELMNINRLNDNGPLLYFSQDSSIEGYINVSGTSVTLVGFSGAHESSGISSDTAIGTVCSTIDELDTYVSGSKEGQERTDHAKIKVSDTVGDSRVYGILSSFTETDNKPTVASVGIGSVLVTGACEGGDLLESNGDGTAKVQDDDIIRSKTIGKVTIGNSDTNVKLVSCVLYCG
jgi:hypothetical protein